MNERDRRIQASYDDARATQARGERLRAAVAANPGKWPSVEKDGVRAEQMGDGDPADELDSQETKLKERDGK